jgi:hypothetical protein
MCQYCAGTGACVLGGMAVLTWIFKQLRNLWLKIIDRNREQ